MRRLTQYGVALVAVAVATLVRYALGDVWGARYAFLTFFPAVMIAAWSGGLGPGLVSVALASLAATFVVPPLGSVRIHMWSDMLALGVFGAAGAMLVALSEALHRARRRAETAARAMQASVSRLQGLFDLTPVGFAISDDPRCERVSVNPRFAELLGIAPHANASPNLAQPYRLLCEGRELTLEELPMQRALATGREVRDIEFQIVRADGRVIDALTCATPVLDGRGRIVGCFSATIDLTAVKRAEGCYRSLVDATTSIVWTADGHGSLLDAPRWGEFTGQTPEEYRGFGFLAAIHPDDREDVALLWERTVRDRRAETTEFRLRRRDGVYRWVTARGVPVLDGAGRLREWVGTVTDIEDGRAATEALRTSEQRFRRVVESNMIGIVFWDEGGRITDANDAFLSMLDRSREDAKAGRLNWRQLIPPDRLPFHTRALDEIRNTGICAPIESEVVRADGSRVPMLCAGTSLGESPLHGVTWVVDISDRKRIEAEREALLRVTERARSEAEDASRQKDEFLAMLGHELRNPLAAVRNAVEAARRGAARRELALDIACRQADQLGRLIDDLLDVARVTQGRIVLRRERVRVVDVIERAVESMGRVTEERGHALVVARPAPELWVDVDPTRLEQVVVNLLTNAVKYTEPGGRIEVGAERVGNEAVLRVRDSGVGIAPEMLARIFEPFAQSERTLDRAQGGLGIGLTVVRRLVQLHGGRVEVRSDGLGKGAEFVVVLPALAASSADEVEAPTGAEAPTTRARVLVVEDNADAAEGLRMLLELAGHEVRVAHDGATALEAARNEEPDLMLVDIGLPGIDGYEVARRIRREPGLRHLVLIALTGYGREADRTHALTAGFDHHIVKPVDPDGLMVLIARLASRDPDSRAPSLH
jgi:PAS domain S-box-containing protein